MYMEMRQTVDHFTFIVIHVFLCSIQLNLKQILQFAAGFKPVTCRWFVQLSDNQAAILNPFIRFFDIFTLRVNKSNEPMMHLPSSFPYLISY